jgi:uncharacterized membrane protein
MHQEENGGFWPGYVAAVACLVLSLLLISAVMAITIMQLGASVGKMVDQQTAKAMVAARQAQTLPSSALPTKPVPGRQSTLELLFPQDAWRLDEVAHKLLLTELDRLIRSGVRGWTISLMTDTSDSLKRRVAYLQLIAVRNVMLEAGVIGDQIVIHMSDVKRDGIVLNVQYPVIIFPKIASYD